jgi:tetratricopeptide (TPR) repeat protein
LIVDYPLAGSIFPPDFASPTFLWRDANRLAAEWHIDVTFSGSAASLHLQSPGERMTSGEIDPRCVSVNNQPPRLTPRQAASRTWRPDAKTWAAIKERSQNGTASVVITGYARGGRTPLSRGKVTIRTAAEPVGAPIFYRDVPLMPSETEKGVIKPLAASAVPLIAWRLRDVGQPKSRVVMEGIYSCANCHSASADGKTLGMDLDGPQNDKGLYALLPIRAQARIGPENMISWNDYRGKLGGRLRVGFMSQVSPDGSKVVTTVAEPEEEQSDYQRRRQPQDLIRNYYVANFKDYRFLQVFFPTRGILAWYDGARGLLQPLPGADDPGYVHTNAVWSPDGRYLVFARAAAKDPYVVGSKVAEFANDPNEVQIRYDLYRIPFNGGKGGRPEPIEGASQNGMSNSFPKVSPDGKWIVWVQARNGQLMRPDSQLYIVAAGGGQSRKMRCNTPLMNSWHSFSPNGRWLVFSSKSRSPYTQMFLTHIDEDGNDSPAILIEDSTAANRAVNIPEFLNIAAGGLEKIEAPVTDYYRIFDRATGLAGKGDYSAAIGEWRRALQLGPAEAAAHFNLANALSKTASTMEAIEEYERALELSPDHAEAHNNLGYLLAGLQRLEEAVPHFEKAVEANPANANAQQNLGMALAQSGRTEEALRHLERAVEIRPESIEAHLLMGRLLAARSNFATAIPHFEEAVRLTDGRDPVLLDLLGGCYEGAHRLPEAIRAAQRALSVAADAGNRQLAGVLKQRLALYESEIPVQ